MFRVIVYFYETVGINLAPRLKQNAFSSIEPNKIFSQIYFVWGRRLGRTD